MYLSHAMHRLFIVTYVEDNILVNITCTLIQIDDALNIKRILDTRLQPSFLVTWSNLLFH